jgi:hypothetical protein
MTVRPRHLIIGPKSADRPLLCVVRDSKISLARSMPGDLRLFQVSVAPFAALRLCYGTI